MSGAMDIGKDTSSNCKYMSLLGKQYPVIHCNVEDQCRTHVELVSTALDTSAGDQGQVNDTDGELLVKEIFDTNKLELSVASTSRDTIEDSTFVVQDVQSDSNSKCETSNGEVVVASEDTISVHDEVEGIDDPSSIDEVVNLALSLDDGSLQQSVFEYEATSACSEDINGNVITTDEIASTEPVSQEEVLVPASAVVDNNKEEQLVNELGNEHDVAVVTESHMPNTLSNLEEGNILPPEFDETPNDSLVSLSCKLDILDYAKAEWKGTTFTAKCLRKGYKQLIKETGCKYMRQVRGDNYCALRASAFQILTQNISILSSCTETDWKDHVINLPERLQQKHSCDWLNQWSFADRLPSNSANRVNVMQSCLSFLIEQKELSDAMTSESDRQAHFSALFNSGSTAEIKLFEALKLLMLECALDLYLANTNGEEVPVFAWLLFARDTSEDPKSLMLNHLNLAGKTGGLEQVEMCLLGQALQITIRVVRPSNVEQEDFMTYYPDHMLNQWPSINLIAEDDRHYNLTVK